MAISTPRTRDVDVAHRSVPELVAILLDKPELVAARLIDAASGLERLSRAEPFEIASLLAGRGADSLRRASAVAAAFELGRRVELARVADRPRLASAADVAAWASPRLASLAHEELWMLGLDGRGFLRAARRLARGGLHGAALCAADPLRAALRVDANAFVLVHNHPSGDPTPSREDEHFTAQVALTASLVGVALLDHVVVAREGFDCVAFDSPQVEAGRSG